MLNIILKLLENPLAIAGIITMIIAIPLFFIKKIIMRILGCALLFAGISLFLYKIFTFVVIL